jgi:uncharacterized protein YecA (UPF0149 family)
MTEVDLADFVITAQPEIELLAKHFNVEESRAVEAYGHLVTMHEQETPLTLAQCLEILKKMLTKKIDQLTTAEGRVGICLGLIRVKQKPFLSSVKTGRNEPCPCNSGAKYKNCCLDEHKKHDYESYKNMTP